MRSLLWQLDHSRVTLDSNSVVILDEAGMTADADLSRLLPAVERSGAKAVLVGDHLQLSAVGPGGALAAVRERHPEVVTELTENLRQHDPAERDALDELRHGDIDTAIDYYTERDRVQIAPSRVAALGTMVNAWANDTQTGQDTLLLAFRRTNVADLNRIARAEARKLGWLTGDDLQTPSGRRYAVGDPVVLLAPNRDGELVTSQRGTITSVDHQAEALTLATDDDRREHIDASRLDHGYAMTVHRQQGSTSDRAHYLADGGGRELAYVAMSRARQQSTVHAVADDLDQAIEDIRHDWTTSRAQQWITPNADIGHDDLEPATADSPSPPQTTDTSDRQLNDRAARILQQLDQLQRKPQTVDSPERSAGGLSL